MDGMAWTGEAWMRADSHVHCGVMHACGQQWLGKHLGMVAMAVVCIVL